MRQITKLNRKFEDKNINVRWSLWMNRSHVSNLVRQTQCKTSMFSIKESHYHGGGLGMFADKYYKKANRERYEGYGGGLTYMSCSS